MKRITVASAMFRSFRITEQVTGVCFVSSYDDILHMLNDGFGDDVVFVMTVLIPLRRF